MRRLSGLVGLIVIIGFMMTAPGRAAFARNLAWISLQRAVLGVSATAEGHLARAGAGFARAAAIQPGDPLALDGLGLVYLQYDDDASAASLFSRVPDTSLWADAARLHLLIVETRDLATQSALVGSVDFNMCRPASMTQQIAAFTAEGRCDRAYEWLSWIDVRCDVSPADRTDLLAAIGACYVTAGAPLAAIGHLEGAVRQSPDHMRAWLVLGDSWRALGDTARAMRAYAAAARLQPDSREVERRLRSLNASR